MIPLRDINPTERRPVVTHALIAINVAVFVLQLLAGGDDGERLVQRFGVIPAYLTSGDLLVPNSAGGRFGSLVTPLTSMFMHGGFMHLLGNMWFLVIFGDNVEDRLGRFRYLVFYLLSGFAAVAAQVAIAPASTLPMIGASGAVSGVLSGYVLLYPRARIITLVPMLFILTTAELPAFVFIFVWFGIQLLSGLSQLSMVEHTGGVAFWAHVGGFVAGLLLVKLLEPSIASRWEHHPAPRTRRFRAGSRHDADL